MDEPIETIPVTGFDSEGEPEIRVMPDRSLYVVFNFMPPSWAEDDDEASASFDDFDQQLATALGVAVDWEDREFFRIDQQRGDTVMLIRKFLETYRQGGITTS